MRRVPTGKSLGSIQPRDVEFTIKFRMLPDQAMVTNKVAERCDVCRYGGN